MAHDTNQEAEKGECQWPVSLLFFLFLIQIVTIAHEMGLSTSGWILPAQTHPKMCLTNDAGVSYSNQIHKKN